MKINKIVIGLTSFFILSTSGFSQEVTATDQLTLDGCVGKALNNSFEVKLAKLDLYIAETDLMYAEAVFDIFMYGGAGYAEDKRQQLSVFMPDDSQENIYFAGMKNKLPSGTEIDVRWADTRNWNNSQFVSKNPSHTSELSMDLVQPVGKNMFGFVDRSNITLTKLAIENADLVTQDRIEIFIANVEKSYWDMVSTKRNVEIYQDMLARAQDLYETDKRNYDRGLIEKVDLLATEANLTTVKSELLIVENNYKMAQENLKFLMNISDQINISPKSRLEHVYYGKDLGDCLNEAFDNRNDYRVRKRDVEIKGLELKVKDNLLWPEIDLKATMAMNGVEENFKKAAGKSFVADNTYYYAGVEFNLPLGNKEAVSQYKKVEYEKEKALVALKEKERSIITEVTNAFQNVMAYQASVDLMAHAVVLEKAKLEEENKRYEYGRSNTKRIIDYQRDLLLAQLEETRFLVQHRKAIVDLERSMDIVLEKYEGKI